MSKQGLYTYFTNEEIDRLPLLRKNSHPIFKNGTIIKTKSCGNIIILGRFDISLQSPSEKYPRYPWYKVIFSDGTLRVVDRGALRRGDIKNPNKPVIYNIGFVGVGKWRAVNTLTGKTTVEYEIWHSMLTRCYSPVSQERNPTYKDCTVDPRWYNFQNFCHDIQFLEGYAEWKADAEKEGRNNYALDKDIKVKSNKVYSKDTCMFVTHKQNTTEAHLTGKTYIATRIKDGYEEEFVSSAVFASKYNIKYSSYVTRVITGERKHTHGWTFRIKEEASE